MRDREKPGASGRRTASAKILLAIAALLCWPRDASAEGVAACPDAAARFDVFSLTAPALGHSAEVTVFLPPGYDCPGGGRYPVFYFNDGQHLFDWSPTTPGIIPEIAAQITVQSESYGSWRLDTQLPQAIADHRLPPMIIVGISSDTGPRSRDLAPVPWAGSDEARGEDYGAFVAGTVVPVIDSLFRTRANRACRGIAGSSLGGVSALQIGMAHPQEFSMIMSLSPVLGDPAIAAYLTAQWREPGPSLPSTLLVDFDDDRVGHDDRDWLEDLIRTESPARHRAVLRQTDAGSHTIESWADRVIPALDTLIDGRCGD